MTATIDALKIAKVRALIWFAAAFLSSFVPMISALPDDAHVTVLGWIKILGGSLLAGCVALGSFIDQRLSRRTDETTETTEGTKP